MLNKIMNVFEHPSWSTDYHNIMIVLPAKLSKLGVHQDLIPVLMYLYRHNFITGGGHRESYGKLREQVANALEMK